MGFPFAPAPDDEALVAWCAARVTPDILIAIAESDYGYDRDECLAWLGCCEAERRVAPHDGSRELVTAGDRPWLLCLDNFCQEGADSCPWTRLSLLARDRSGEVCPPLVLLRDRLKGPTWPR